MNPNGEEVNDCHFEYGTTVLRLSVPCASCTPFAGVRRTPGRGVRVGHGPQREHAYHFRISRPTPMGRATAQTSRDASALPDGESVGSTPGPVEVVGLLGTLVSPLSAEPVSPAGLPPGRRRGCRWSVVQRQRCSARGSIDVTLNLPPGSEPTNVYKLVGGIYNDVTSLSTISGDSVTLHLTDGVRPGDEDGEANGVIVYLLVPVHQPKPPAVATEHSIFGHPDLATLNATVNPNGQTVSDCHFEYGGTEAYGLKRAVRFAAGLGQEPGRGLRVDNGPHREHDLPPPHRR